MERNFFSEDNLKQPGRNIFSDSDIEQLENDLKKAFEAMKQPKTLNERIEKIRQSIPIGASKK